MMSGYNPTSGRSKPDTFAPHPGYLRGAITTSRVPDDIAESAMGCRTGYGARPGHKSGKRFLEYLYQAMCSRNGFHCQIMCRNRHRRWVLWLYQPLPAKQTAIAEIKQEHLQGNLNPPKTFYTCSRGGKVLSYVVAAMLSIIVTNVLATFWCAHTDGRGWRCSSEPDRKPK